MKRIRLKYFKGITKRFLVWLAALAMLITIAPSAVFADTDESGADQTNPSKTEETEQDPEILVGAWEEQVVSHEAKAALSIKTLTQGKSTTVTGGDGSSVVFSFTPKVAGEYTFSTGNRKSGTYGAYLYDGYDAETEELTDLLEYDPDNDDDGVCKVKQELVANHKYYFEIQPDDDEDFSCVVTVNKTQKVTITFQTGKEANEAWYYSDGGGLVSFARETYEVGDPVDFNPPSCIDGLLFVGWSVNPDASEADPTPIYAKSGMTSLYAVWKKLVPLTVNGETQLSEEDGSTYYIFEPENLTSKERYEVSVQLQGNGEAVEILSSLYDFDVEGNADLIGSHQEQGSSFTWLLPQLSRNQDYYLFFKDVNGAALNGTILLQKVNVERVTFEVNRDDAYFFTRVDEDTGEEERITSVTEMFKTGTVIQSNAQGTSTSIHVPTWEGNIRFLGWSINQNATAPDAEIVLGTSSITVYGVWETIQEHTHTPAPAVRENETAATCTAGGSYDEVIYCAVCKEELSREHKTTPATGHDWDEGVVTTKPTCEGKGIRTFTCTHDSSHTKTEEIAATGHSPADPVREKEEAATCTAGGSYDEVTYCSECKAELSREHKTTPATGHDWDEGVVTTKPTCEGKGVKTFTCKHDSSHTKTEEIPATGHTPAAAASENLTPATCTEDGSYDIVVRCSVCDAILSKETKPITATGHVPAAAANEDIVPATCTEDGSYNIVVRCSVCKEVLSSVPKTIQSSGHKWNEGEITTPATCEGKGIKTFTCQNDQKHTRTEEIPALGHKWNEGEITTPATCEGKGIKTFTCQNDQKHSRTEEIPALGHDWDEGVVTTKPTCEGKGVKTYTCKHDSNHTMTEEIAATGHVPGATVIENSEASCSQEGSYEEVVYCSVCGAELSRESHTTGKIPHTPAEEIRENEVPATCTTDGSYVSVIKCSVCSEELSRETKTIPAFDHDWDEGEETTPAACGKAGIKTFTCKHDKTHTRTETIPALEHDWDEGKVTTPATCETPGVKTFTCKHDASHTRTEVIQAIGHDWDEGTVTTPASCETEGVRTFTCKNDKNHTRTEPVSATGHTPAMAESENYVPATCTADGSYDLVERCSVCHEVIHSEKNTIPAPGHKAGAAERENVVPATCETDGSYDMVVRCTACKEVISSESKTISKLGHDWDEGKVTKPVTCEEDGEKTFTCRNDEKHTRTETISKLGHDWDEGKITKPATCEEDGVKTFTCRNDEKHTRTEDVPATGHKWGKWTVQKEATDEEDGWEKRICENDPSHEETRIIPKQNHVHSMKKVDAKAASLEEAGWIEHWECDGCGLLYADEDGKGPLNAEDITIPKLINVSEAQISISEAVYTGGALAPAVTVILSGKALVKDTDYTLAFSNNTNAGKGNVTVTGIGLYGGTAEAEFTIKKAPSTLTLKNKTATYTGEEITIDPAVSEGSSEKVTYTYYKDEDCSEPAESHANVGTYYVKADLAADDNHEAASAKAVLTIGKAPSQATLQGKTVTYNGKPVSSNKASVTGSTGEIRYSYYSDKACTKGVAVPQNAGTYYVKATVEADANFEEASAVATIVIKPVTPKISVKAGSVKFAKVKKKAQPVKGTIRISLPSGKATYIRVKKGSSKCLTINKKTGTITVQRGTKKGTYKIKVKVTVPKTRNSTALSKTVTVKVKVR